MKLEKTVSRLTLCGTLKIEPKQTLLRNSFLRKSSLMKLRFQDFCRMKPNEDANGGSFQPG